MIGHERYLVSVEILNKENENFEKKLCCVNGINFNPNKVKSGPL